MREIDLTQKSMAFQLIENAGPILILATLTTTDCKSCHRVLANTNTYYNPTVWWCAEMALPSMDGMNLAPSSFAHTTTAIGCLVMIPDSLNTWRISRPPSTPRMRSYLPPVGCVSRCDPIAIGGPSVVPESVAKNVAHAVNLS